MHRQAEGIRTLADRLISEALVRPVQDLANRDAVEPRLPRDLLQVGDVVSFAGNPSTRTERRMYVTNLLVRDGREILLRGNVPPRWPDALGSPASLPVPGTRTSRFGALDPPWPRSWTAPR